MTGKNPAEILSGRCCGSARLLHIVEAEAAVVGVGRRPAALHPVGVDMNNERF